MYSHFVCTGKSQKKKLLERSDSQFDIAAALKTRKPLRKTSTALALEGTYIHFNIGIMHAYQAQTIIVSCDIHTGITAPASDASKIKSEFQRKLEARRNASHGKDMYTVVYSYPSPGMEAVAIEDFLTFHGLL
jgi:hypothetical protein